MNIQEQSKINARILAGKAVQVFKKHEWCEDIFGGGGKCSPLDFYDKSEVAHTIRHELSWIAYEFIGMTMEEIAQDPQSYYYMVSDAVEDSTVEIYTSWRTVFVADHATNEWGDPIEVDTREMYCNLFTSQARKNELWCFFPHYQEALNELALA